MVVFNESEAFVLLIVNSFKSSAGLLTPLLLFKFTLLKECLLESFKDLTGHVYVVYQIHNFMNEIKQ